MAYADLPLDQLRSYRSTVEPPGDLTEFWNSTLEQARGQAREPELSPVDNGLARVETFDVRYSGFDGERIAAWLHLPTHRTEPLPVVVRYWGYGRGRGLSHEVPLWLNAGYAVLACDMRGQGGQHGPGDTPDPHGSHPSHPGFLTQGILDKETYYYRRLFTDAALAVDAVPQLGLGLDSGQVIAMGGSQGGGVAIAAAALHPGITGLMADVPFLSDFPRAVMITNTDPYAELVRYLKIQHGRSGQAMDTLRYFDAAVLATHASAPALFSVGLMDPICPPSTVYAAYNAYGGPKEIREYPFAGHEGGQAWQEREQLDWLRRR